jgi:hypothetical protein
LVPAIHVFVLRGTNKVDGRHTGESQRFRREVAGPTTSFAALLFGRLCAGRTSQSNLIVTSIFGGA